MSGRLDAPGVRRDVVEAGATGRRAAGARDACTRTSSRSMPSEPAPPRSTAARPSAPSATCSSNVNTRPSGPSVRLAENVAGDGEDVGLHRAADRPGALAAVTLERERDAGQRRTRRRSASDPDAVDVDRDGGGRRPVGRRRRPLGVQADAADGRPVAAERQRPPDRARGVDGERTGLRRRRDRRGVRPDVGDLARQRTVEPTRPSSSVDSVGAGASPRPPRNTHGAAASSPGRRCAPIASSTVPRRNVPWTSTSTARIARSSGCSTPTWATTSRTSSKGVGDHEAVSNSAVIAAIEGPAMSTDTPRATRTTAPRSTTGASPSVSEARPSPATSVSTADQSPSTSVVSVQTGRRRTAPRR